MRLVVSARRRPGRGEVDTHFPLFMLGLGFLPNASFILPAPTSPVCHRVRIPIEAFTPAPLMITKSPLLSWCSKYRPCLIKGVPSSKSSQKIQSGWVICQFWHSSAQGDSKIDRTMVPETCCPVDLHGTTFRLLGGDRFAGLEPALHEEPEGQPFQTSTSSMNQSQTPLQSA